MAIVVGADEGTSLGGEFSMFVRVRSEDTNGAMAVIEQTVPPRRLIPPHTHENDVWVHVLSGEVGILVGDEIAHAGPGSWALKPRDVVHAMWNRGDIGAHIIEVLTPAGSERWFEEIAALATGDKSGFDEACRRHGIRFLRDSPWTEKLRSQFQLR